MRAKKIWNSIYIRFVLLLLVTFLYRHYKLNQDISYNKKIEEDIKRETVILNDKIKSLNYDLENSNSLEFVEKQARKQGMIKPREIQILDLDKDKEE